MALNIKNAEIHWMAHELARRTGKSLTQAVGDALRRELERAPKTAEAKSGRARAVLEPVWADLGDAQGKAPDHDALLYDPDGLAK